MNTPDITDGLMQQESISPAFQQPETVKPFLKIQASRICSTARSGFFVAMAAGTFSVASFLLAECQREAAVRGLNLNWLTGRKGDDRRERAQQLRVREASPAEGFRPVQSGVGLLQADSRRRFIRMLTENSPLSRQVTEAWWLHPLEVMAAHVQACPAAWSGAYSGPGGFIDLSLNVAVRSVRRVRGMMLPPGATPEEQAEQVPGWVCAVCWAGLFHHADWLTQMEGELKSGRVWYPGLSVPDEAWRVRPKRLQAGTMSGVYLAVKLLPEAGLIWLQRWPALSDSLLMFLSGRRAESGLLNSIISDARSGCDREAGRVSAVQAPAGMRPVPEVTEHDPVSLKLQGTEVRKGVRIPPVLAAKSAPAGETFLHWLRAGRSEVCLNSWI